MMIQSVTYLVGKEAQGSRVRLKVRAILLPTRWPLKTPAGPPIAPVPNCPLKNEMV